MEGCCSKCNEYGRGEKMFLKRETTANISEIRRVMGTEFGGLGDGAANMIAEFVRLYQVSEAAQKEIATKLENLDAEFQVNYDYNPIHHIEGRMKEPNSLMEKLSRKEIPYSIEGIKQNVYDIAGLRVITNYINDIYTIEKLLTEQDDVTIIKRKDYIANPKKSGYRSLHLVVKVPVFLSTGPEETAVEVQIRTVGMEMWASLEHKLKYKNASDKIEQFSEELIHYSDELNNIERHLELIHQEI